MILTVKTKDTVLTSKGTTSIPAAIRQAAGLFLPPYITYRMMYRLRTS